MKINFRMPLVVLLSMSLAFGVPSVYAQDGTEVVDPTATPTDIPPVIDPIPDPEQPAEPIPSDTVQGELAIALETLIKALSNIVFIPVAVPLVTAVTGLLKQWIPVNPAYIALAAQVLVWIAWLLIKQAGYADQFDNWINMLTTLLTTGSALFLSVWGSAKLYNSSRKAEVPILGTEGSALKDSKPSVT